MTTADLQPLIAAALSPGRWLLPPDARPTLEFVPEAGTLWEVFRGHLLGPGQTRQERTFAAWHFRPSPAAPPLISLWHDAGTAELHVTRTLDVYGWETYDEAGTIQVREAVKPLRELVGTIDLARPGPLADVLAGYLERAVEGASRLPIVSVESPLPAFALGQLGYLTDRQAERPAAMAEDLLGYLPTTPAGRRFRVLETYLRLAPPDEPRSGSAFLTAWYAAGLPAEELPALGRELFHHLALSPFTGLVARLTAFWLELADPAAGWRAGATSPPGPLPEAGRGRSDRERGEDPPNPSNRNSPLPEAGRGVGGERSPQPAAVLDLFGYHLRHLVRHLTAFDLVTFHNQGANFPDALALDAWLSAFLQLAERHPDAIAGPEGRLRRRALRQGWLARKQCEGLAVPDHPTSPGDNLRVLPEPFRRLPDEQIQQPRKRSRKLFPGAPAEGLLTPAGRRLLEASLADLDEPAELRELGTAVFLDRPLGVFKPSGALDRTPLLSYEAFSRSVAKGRLAHWQRLGFLDAERQRHLTERLQALPAAGVPVTDLPGRERPGVVALEDAFRAAPDFVFLRTTRSSLQALLAGYDLMPLPAEVRDWLHAGPVLLIRDRAPAFLTAFDAEGRPRLRLVPAEGEDRAPEYREWAGVEYLAAGLRAAPDGPILAPRPFRA